MGIRWEEIGNFGELPGGEMAPGGARSRTYRARVTGHKGEMGWLVLVQAPNGGGGLTYVPDEGGIWDGSPANQNISGATTSSTSLRAI